jgi:hypothetical protein
MHGANIKIIVRPSLILTKPTGKIIVLYISKTKIFFGKKKKKKKKKT